MRELSFTPKDQHTRDTPLSGAAAAPQATPTGIGLCFQADTNSLCSLRSAWLPRQKL